MHALKSCFSQKAKKLEWQLKICNLDLSSSSTKIHKEIYHQNWGLTRWSKKTYSEKLWCSVSNLSCGIHKTYIKKTIKRFRFLLRRFTKNFKFVFFLRNIFCVILFLCCTAESCPNGNRNNKNSRYSHVGVFCLRTAKEIGGNFLWL